MRSYKCDSNFQISTLKYQRYKSTRSVYKSIEYRLSNYREAPICEHDSIYIRFATCEFIHVSILSGAGIRMESLIHPFPDKDSHQFFTFLKFQ